MGFKGVLKKSLIFSPVCRFFIFRVLIRLTLLDDSMLFLADCVDCVRMESRLRRGMEGFSSRFNVFLWILLCVPPTSRQRHVPIVFIQKVLLFFSLFVKHLQLHLHSVTFSHSWGGYAGTARRCKGTLGRVVCVANHRRRRRSDISGVVWVLAVLHLQVHNRIRMWWYRCRLLCAQHRAIGS